MPPASRLPRELVHALKYPELILHILSAIYKPTFERPGALHRITRETVASQVRSPSFAWSQRVRHVNYGECYYFQPISVDDVDSLDAQLACEHFNQVPYNCNTW